VKLQFQIDKLTAGKGQVICRADLTLQAVQPSGNLMDLITVKECGLCPSRKGGHVLLSPARTYEAQGETRWVNLVSWPQNVYDAATKALLAHATAAGMVEGEATITKDALQDAGLVDDDDPFADS
jgi:hypothetical protein